MKLRSLLFVPGDRPERMDKALWTQADALILDLEDAVAPARKDEPRAAVVNFLSRRAHAISTFVWIDPLDTDSQRMGFLGEKGLFRRRRRP
jgi:citrate lyase subunit beta/citryl-CoA lyase